MGTNNRSVKPQITDDQRPGNQSAVCGPRSYFSIVRFGVRNCVCMDNEFYTSDARRGRIPATHSRELMSHQESRCD